MAPVKKLTRKEKVLIDSPWITSGILASICTRDLLHSEFLKEKIPLFDKIDSIYIKLKRIW